MDVESLVISGAIKEGTIKPLLERGVNEDFFMTDEKPFKTLVKYYDKHSTMPSKELFEELCPTFEYVEPKDSLSGLTESLSKTHVARKQKLLIKNLAKMLKEGDVDEFNKFAFDNIVTLEKVIKPRTRFTLAEGVPEMLKYYSKAQIDEGGIRGIPTLWKKLNEAIGGLKGGDLFTIAGRPGTGKCISEDSLITISDGSMITIKEFCDQKRKFVLSYDEKKHKVVKSKVVDWIYSGKKEVYEVKLRSGKKVSVTREHPFFTDEYKWVKLSEGLKEGDRVAVPKQLPAPSKDFSEHSDTEIEALAIMLSDGGFTKTYPTVTNPNKCIIAKVRKFAKKKGCVLAQSPSDTISYRIVKNKKVPSLCSSDVSRFFSGLGLMGKKSPEKFIPQEVFKYSKRQLKLFLGMIFSTDGTIVELSTGHIFAEFCSTSESFARGIQSLLLRFGIFSSLRFKKNKKLGAWIVAVEGNQLDMFKAAFRLAPHRQKTLNKVSNTIKRNSNVLVKRLTPEEYEMVCKKIDDMGIADFCKKMNLKHKGFNKKNLFKRKGQGIERMRKLARVLNIPYFSVMSDSVVFDEIVSVTSQGEQNVYDLSIEGTHNFVANDIVVHNSWLLCALAICAWGAGAKVLFITEEMTPEELLHRMSCMLARVSPEKFESGTLDKTERLRLSKVLKAFKDTGDKLIISGSAFESESSGLMPVIARVQEEQPDICFVDGAYLLTDSTSKLQEWQLFLKLTRRIKKLALREKIPFVISSQINREGD